MTENLTKASHDLEFALGDLKACLRDASEDEKSQLTVLIACMDVALAEVEILLAKRIAKRIAKE